MACVEQMDDSKPEEFSIPQDLDPDLQIHQNCHKNICFPTRILEAYLSWVANPRFPPIGSLGPRENQNERQC